MPLRRTRLVVVVLLSFVTFAPARADVVSPQQDVCYDKKPGDACTTCTGAIDAAMCGTCVVPPPSCQAGACRRFGDQTSCLAEPGCSWESRRPVCDGAPCACKQDATNAKNAEPSADKASSCAAGAPLSLGALVVVFALSMLRRRGRRGGLPHE